MPGTVTYPVKAPDGKTYPVKGPPGATREQLVDVLLHYHPEAAKPAPRTGGEVASAAARQIGRGIADVPDLLAAGGHYLNPLNWISAGVDKVAGTHLTPKYTPGVANKVVDKVANALGAAKTEEGSDTEKLWGAGLRAASGSVIPGVGLGETALAGLSGMSGGVAQEYTRQHGGGTVAQIAAGLAGGLGPGALRTAPKTIGKALSYVTDKGAEERAASALQANTSNIPKAIERLDEAKPITSYVKPTTAEVTRDPNQAAFERSRPSSELQRQKNNNELARRRALDYVAPEGDAAATQSLSRSRVQAGETRLEARQRVIEAERQRILAEGETALQKTTGETQAELAARQAQAEADLASVQAKGEAAIGAHQAQGEAAVQSRIGEIHDQNISREESAIPLREGFEAEHQAAKDVTKEKYGVPELTNPSVLRMGPRAIKQMYNGISGKITKFYANAGGEVPAGADKVLADLVAEISEGNLNTATIANVDRRLADFAGAKRMTGGAKNSEAAFAEQLRQEIANATDKYVPRKVKAALADAKAARRDQAQRFEDGRIGPIFKPERYPGRDRVPNTELARKLVTSGDPGATLAQELKASVGHEAASKLVAEEMRRMADEGTLTANAVRNFGPALKEFPELQSRVSALIEQQAANKTGLAGVKATNAAELAKQKAANVFGISTQRAAGEARISAEKLATSTLLETHARDAAELIAEQKAANSAFKATPLGKLHGDLADPIKEISGMVGDKNHMDDLIKEVQNSGDKSALNGVRRALAEHIKNASEGTSVTGMRRNVPDARKARDAIQQVITNGDKALTADQRELLKHLHNELGGTVFTKDQGVLAKTYSNQNIPGVTGIVARTLKWAITKFGNEEVVDKVLAKAIRNPEFASTLLKRATKQRRASVYRALRTGTAAGSLAAYNQSPPPPDTQDQGQ